MKVIYVTVLVEMLWMSKTLGSSPDVLWPPRSYVWSLSSGRSLAGCGCHIVPITKETTCFVWTCPEWVSHLKSSAQTMRIALWSQERNEGNKNYLKMPASIYKMLHCNNVPWDRRCIYFCRIPGYLSVIKTHSFASPRNQNKQSRFSPTCS